jgi:Mn-dependent DtxR family transcriptional regulator
VDGLLDALAKRMGLTKALVAERSWPREGPVERAPERPSLTAEDVASRSPVRKHRLLERFLVDLLSPWPRCTTRPAA